AALSPLSLALAVLLRTYLQTGLFIVAHDAMHGSLLPCSRRWNDRLGRLALGLYACLPWQACRRNHHRHHRHPAGPGDPDHHGGRSRHGLAWYGRFMTSYLRPLQLVALLACWLPGFLLLSGLTPHPLANLLLFGVLPLWLSSLQLFVFGTYLPHRRGAAVDRHHAVSLPLPRLLSLLACYHFGYHWEHHDAPTLPWFALHARHRTITDRQPIAPRLALPQASR
ncbi:MAG: fatty acid desaturase, partial [Synechococcaceae cyanobacterium]|nr:fatty acid desaturase [Synechococcaceae cyanobacterium]